MRQSANNRALRSARSRSTLWHVGGLIPGRQGTRCDEVFDLQQALPQLRKLDLRRVGLAPALSIVHVAWG
jgi:hypothetical protein